MRFKHFSFSKRLIGVVFALLCGEPSAVLAQHVYSLENSLARAYLYIAANATWPPEIEKSDVFVFCTTRSHALYDVFTTLLPTRRVHDKPVELRLLKEADKDSQRQCHLMALPNDKPFNEKILENVETYPVLTIAHEVDITEIGGLVFLAHDDRLRPPRIDIDGLKRRSLRIAAPILKISLDNWGPKKEKRAPL
ncbi:MAG: YfiR family protein [Deltaproteobacteria bacterium]|nr:YfiR family protein [Deltaproteobacteria bacterium]